jgi:hypothetical protein
MHTLTILVRAATLMLFLTLVPGGDVVAQAHKGKHHATSQQTKAKPAQQAATPQPAKPMHPQPAAPEAPAQHSQSHQPPKSTEELVASLHSTKTHLAQVAHDDQGHKTKALQEVGNAIKLLSPRAGSASPVKGALTASSAEHPAAATSAEAHLGEAQRLLQAVESQMSGHGVTAHQYIQARNSVQNALRELNLAQVDR